MKDSVFNIRVSPKFKEQFDSKCQEAGETASAVLRRMMRDYVNGAISYNLGVDPNTTEEKSNELGK